VTPGIDALGDENIHDREDADDYEEDKEDLPVLPKSFVINPEPDKEDAKESENCARSSHADRVGPDDCAQHVSFIAAQQENENEVAGIIDVLLYSEAHREYTKHVPEQVQEAVVKEAGGDGTPHLVLLRDIIGELGSECSQCTDPLFIVVVCVSHHSLVEDPGSHIHGCAYENEQHGQRS